MVALCCIVKTWCEIGLQCWPNKFMIASSNQFFSIGLLKLVAPSAGQVNWQVTATIAVATPVMSKVLKVNQEVYCSQWLVQPALIDRPTSWLEQYLFCPQTSTVVDIVECVQYESAVIIGRAQFVLIWISSVLVSVSVLLDICAWRISNNTSTWHQ